MSAPAATNLYLVGLRGTGKSTVGRLLAERLGVPFHDADAELEARTGRTIRDIFAAEGERHFRDLEHDVLKSLSESGPAVVATGGGVVLREDNRVLLRAGRVICLTANVDTMLARLQGDATTAERRPNLTVGGRVEIEELQRVREPLYRACADLVIDTTGRSPEEIVRRILESC